jgi:hypothetical protein
MRVHRRPAATTVAAIGLIVALTTVFAVSAVQRITAIDPGRVTLDPDEARLGLNPHMANNATALSGGLILVVCVLALGAAVGIALRRSGARHAAIVVFGVLGVLALAASLGGLTATPRSENALYGLACGIANAVIVGLLLAPSTADDFDRVEHERQWLLARGYPLGQDPPARDRGPTRGDVRSP